VKLLHVKHRVSVELKIVVKLCNNDKIGVMLQRFTPHETDETRLYEAVTRNINTALTILFSIECILKIFGFGLRVNLLQSNYLNADDVLIVYTVFISFTT